MNFPLILIGACMVVAGFQNNADCAISLLREQVDFIPWIIAVGILYAIWVYTPGDAGSIAKDIIAVGLLGILILNFPTLNTEVQKAWGVIPGASNFSSILTGVKS